MLNIRAGIPPLSFLVGECVAAVYSEQEGDCTAVNLTGSQNIPAPKPLV